MEQVQHEEDYAQQDVGYIECSYNENSSTERGKPIHCENPDLLSNNENYTLMNQESTNTGIYSPPTHLINSSETLCQSLSFQTPIHDPPPSENEPVAQETIESVESLEDLVDGNELNTITVDPVPNDFQQCDTDDAVTAAESTDIHQNESIPTIENQSWDELQNETESHITLNSNENVQVEPLEETSYVEKFRESNTLDQREVEDHNETNSFIQTSPSFGKKETKHDPFLDLDIPRPVFSTSDDDEKLENLPPTSKKYEDMIDSVDENIQERISNQSGQRIEAPQAFIPSSQLMMTKRSLEEGNSFLRCILAKLKNINEFLHEKTSKILS